MQLEMEAHRVLLLALSDKMSTEDVQRLLFISPLVPFSEGITRGYQLFMRLESMGLIDPGNYSFLSERLQQIGRIDLDNMLPFLERRIGTSYVPTELQASNQILEAVFVMKQGKLSLYKSAMLKVVNDPLAWKKHVDECVLRYIHVSSMNFLPEQSMTCTGDSSKHIMEGLSSGWAFLIDYFTAFLPYMLNTERVDVQVVKLWSERMFDQCKLFEDATKNFLPQKGLLIPTSTEFLGCIESVCADMHMLDPKKVVTEATSTRELLYQLKHCSCDSAIGILSWMANCIHLAANSQLDLKPSYDILALLVMKQKTLITNYYNHIESILGHQFLTATLPFAIDKTRCLELDKLTPSVAEIVFVPQICFLVFLLALAKGTNKSNDIQGMASGISVFLSNEVVNGKAHQCGMAKYFGVANVINIEIENLTSRVIDLCPAQSPQQLLLKRLLSA